MGGPGTTKCIHHVRLMCEAHVKHSKTQRCEGRLLHWTDGFACHRSGASRKGPSPAIQTGSRQPNPTGSYFLPSLPPLPLSTRRPPPQSISHARFMTYTMLTPERRLQLLEQIQARRDRGGAGSGLARAEGWGRRRWMRMWSRRRRRCIRLLASACPKHCQC